mmetsp:Transcript_29417/g.80741  ORF Transcript_29417/g.80741 Transcript_29417/m.80741 type:complete len:213 (+) Transcript_29417:554-1192(+)
MGLSRPHLHLLRDLRVALLLVLSSASHRHDHVVDERDKRVLHCRHSLELSQGFQERVRHNRHEPEAHCPAVHQVAAHRCLGWYSVGMAGPHRPRTQLGRPPEAAAHRAGRAAPAAAEDGCLARESQDLHRVQQLDVLPPGGHARALLPCWHHPLGRMHLVLHRQPQRFRKDVDFGALADGLVLGYAVRLRPLLHPDHHDHGWLWGHHASELG